MGTVPVRQIQIFYNYDKSFVDKLRSIAFHTIDEKGNDSARPLACVFATPERAFAQMAKQIIKRKGLQMSEDEVIKTIPLPIASVSRLQGNIDLSRFVNADVGVPDQYNENWYSARRPMAWSFQYQVDIWTREIQVMDDLQVQMLQWLRANEFWMSVEHPDPIRTLRVLARLNNSTDNSVLESEKDQRKIRRTFTFDIDGWICYPMLVSKQVQMVIAQFYESGGFVEGIEVTEDSVLPLEAPVV